MKFESIILSQLIFTCISLNGIAQTENLSDSLELNELDGILEPRDMSSSEIDSVEADFLAIRVKKYSDSVVVRWAPSTRRLWLKASKIGYFIQRYTMPSPEQNESNIQPEIDVLVDGLSPLLPWDSTRWSGALPIKDGYALIAAASTHGSLEVSGDPGYASKHKQDMNIYAMVLMSADRSTLAADGLALRYSDTDVEVGKTYYYQVGLPDMLLNIPPDPALTLNNLVRFDGQNQVDTLVDLASTYMDHQVKLSWPVKQNRVFSSYHIERSSDGGETYDSLTTTPYITQEIIDPTTQQTYFQFLDSLSENYVHYTYRVTGLDAFAGSGKPQIVVGMGVDLTPPKSPIIRSGTELNDGTIRVSWQLPDVPSDFARLSVDHAHNPQSQWTSIATESLTSADTFYIYKPEAASNYFRVTASDTAGNVSASFPIYVDIVDSMPPAIPSNLEGTIDTTGLVTLNWDMGKELDLKGYRVYYANNKKHEFTQLTSNIVYNDTVTYQISINTLSEKIYYKIQAVDNHFNHSAFTEILELAKPDTIPPVVPVFYPPKSSEEGIQLNWSLSSSLDVVEQYLIRYVSDSIEEAQTFPLSLNQSVYIDKSAEKGVMYTYQLIAVDDSGLESKRSFPVKARVVNKKQSPRISNLQVRKRDQKVRLTWDYSEMGDYRFTIYRNLGSNVVKRYRSVEGGERDFTDEAKEAGTYYYAVKVVHRDGSKSLLSEVVSIGFQ
ncbi:MAG: hypothetical protein GY816_19035 [Cytophagales bacterium]|nr:hypothetical protein [Cytophagales bacterium]